VNRLRQEGKSIGDTHIEKCRSWLTRYILEDRALVRKPIGSITRADLLDYRNRLIEKLGDKKNTINKVMATLKVIFKEAYFRQDISFDPTQGIGNIKEERKEPGIFTTKELKAHFPDESYGPWKDIWDYTCFLVAATTGMRKSEVLALQWADMPLKAPLLHHTRMEVREGIRTAQVE
jgi:integrase